MTTILKQGDDKTLVSLLPLEHEDLRLWAITVHRDSEHFYLTHMGKFYHSPDKGFVKTPKGKMLFNSEELALEKAAELAGAIEIGGLHVLDLLRLEESGDINRTAVVEQVIFDRLFSKKLR